MITSLVEKICQRMIDQYLTNVIQKLDKDSIYLMVVKDDTTAEDLSKRVFSKLDLREGPKIALVTGSSISQVFEIRQEKP